MLEKLLAKRLAAAEKEMIARYYAEVEEMFSRMRGWRHDYRHHIQTMKAHAKAGEYAEIDAYLDMLDADLTEVETVIRSLDVVQDTAVIGVKASGVKGEEICAFVVLRDGCTADMAKRKLQDICKSRLPAYSVPNRFLFLAKLPRNRMNKIDKMELEKLL